jgi:uncharacterized membrane protein
VGIFFATQPTQQTTTIIMNKPINSPTDLAKRSLSRLLASILLITGALALLSAVAMFAFHIIVPIAAFLVVGIFIARGVLHSHARKTESLGSDLGRFSMETVSEAAKITWEFTRSTTAAFRSNTNGMRNNSVSERNGDSNP